jgi:hypothetical protein
LTSHQNIAKHLASFAEIDALYQNQIAPRLYNQTKSLNLTTNVFYLLKDSYSIIKGLSDLKTRKTMAIVASAIGLHVILLETAGYVIAATVCFWGVAYAFGSRKILKDLVISAVFAVIVYFSFSKGLNINLPSGVFEGILK